MPRKGEGERVGAILSASDGVVRLLGYGELTGRVVPEPRNDMTLMMHKGSLRTPRILLDGGQVVYGCECWWSAETKIQDRIRLFVEMGWRVENASVESLFRLSPMAV